MRSMKVEGLAKIVRQPLFCLRTSSALWKTTSKGRDSSRLGNCETLQRDYTISSQNIRSGIVKGSKQVAGMIYKMRLDGQDINVTEM